ncbi:hypothetical protein HDU87_006663 [Geranomyces variabilis]|uniref:Uncharacterized protein n=1 Tax=Geranomyces variabilis TaxID=109894 RepID=A0AAD5TFE0_9FUNG|nr:hypothetical protein HDU87_006663 [Geranomyces variabilis]
MVRAGGAMFVYLMSLKLQRVLHLSPWETAIQSLPMAVCGFLYSFFVGSFVKRFGFRSTVILGFCLATIGAAWFLFSVHGANDHGQKESSFWTSTLPSSVFFVLGTPTVFISAQLAMLHSAQPKEYAMIGALFSTAAQIGGPVGLAVLTAAMNSAMEANQCDEQRLIKSYDVGSWVIVVWELAGVAIAGTYALVGISQRRKGYEAVSADDKDSNSHGEQRPLLEDRENAN